jgi:hypothetical protein
MGILKGSEGSEIVSTMTMIYKLLLGLLLLGLISCGSSKIAPTKDVCTVEKHYKDMMFQVKINGEEINQHWYLKTDAIEIVQKLAAKNKCTQWR